VGRLPERARLVERFEHLADDFVVVPSIVLISYGVDGGVVRNNHAKEIVSITGHNPRNAATISERYRADTRKQASAAIEQLDDYRRK
jgi:hypothetical protein